MLDDFLIRAALAAVGTAICASVLGCFVVWRRMAYFGDATAHAAVLGVALALGFGVSITLGVVVVALGMALLIHSLSGRGTGIDTLLGVFSHGALAIGLVAVTMIPGQRIDLDAYLFGDVLSVSRWDIAVIWGGGALVVAALWWWWSGLLTATISPDLAYAAGIDPRRMQLLLTLLLAAVVAVAIKVVGALLITALLIIPAATARGLARTPERMALIAVGIGVVSALGGLRFAMLMDTPVGPSIICVAVALFAISAVSTRLRFANS